MPHSVAILRYSGYRARRVCALQSSSYSMWAFSLGSLYLLITLCMLTCVLVDQIITALSISFVLLLIFILLLVISYWKRRWFHSEPGHQNPYKTVYEVLKFAKSHKHPLRRLIIVIIYFRKCSCILYSVC